MSLRAVQVPMLSLISTSTPVKKANVVQGQKRLMTEGHSSVETRRNGTTYEFYNTRRTPGDPGKQAFYVLRDFSCEKTGPCNLLETTILSLLNHFYENCWLLQPADSSLPKSTVAPLVTYGRNKDFKQQVQLESLRDASTSPPLAYPQYRISMQPRCVTTYGMTLTQRGMVTSRQNNNVAFLDSGTRSLPVCRSSPPRTNK